MSTQNGYETGQVVWYLDTGQSDTGIITHIDSAATDGYSLTVLFASDMSEDMYRPNQIGTFATPDPL